MKHLSKLVIIHVIIPSFPLPLVPLLEKKVMEVSSL